MRALGEKPYLALYSLVALATLGWAIGAWRVAPGELLFAGLRFVPLVVMPFAFVLLACGLARNPMAPGAGHRLAGAEPARGILRVTRHPVMWAIMLWAASHILARGELHATIFFGTMFLLGALGSVLQERRKVREMPEGWRRYAEVTSHVPFVAIAQGRNRFALAEIGWARPAAGLALYALALALHPWLFGARPY